MTIDYRIIVPLVASFMVTLFLLPFWIRKAKQIGLIWEDMNKKSTEKVSGSGGIIVVLGFLIGVLVYVAYRVFILKIENGFLIDLFAMLTSVLLLAGIGFIDDLFGWRKGGLSRRYRIILIIIAAIPLMVVNAGRSSMTIPFLGTIDFGIIYPLIFIPLGIIGTTATFNFLAGFNGLEAGQGILMLLALSATAFFTGNSWLSIVGLCMVLSLTAFLLFNYNPARVFPGDILTYPVGGLIAIMAILGNFEKIAVFIFIPTMVEFFLKARGKFNKQSFGLPKKDGSLDLRYDKIYSLNHLAIYLIEKRGVKPTEKRVVQLIWAFQILIIILGFLLFREGIFYGL